MERLQPPSFNEVGRYCGEKASGRFVLPDGTIVHLGYGDRHNENGPAIILPNGQIFYFLNNKKCSEKGWLKEIMLRKEYIKNNKHTCETCLMSLL